MSIITLESKNLISTSLNSTWETKTCKDILIENGDVILMKNAYLNIDQNSNTNINITEDTVINIEYGFYMINGIQNIYLSYKDNNPDPMIYMYTPTYIINNNTAYPPFTAPSNYTGYANQYYYEATDFKPYVLHKSDGSGGYEIIKKNRFFTIFKGSYTPTELAYIITKHMNSLNNIELQDIENDDNIGLNLDRSLQYEYALGGDLEELFVGDSYSNNNVNWGTMKKFRLAAYDGVDIPADVMPDIGAVYLVGANQFSLDFNDDSQKFQFSFMHSPLYDNKGNVSVGLFQTYWDKAVSVADDTETITAIGPINQQSKTSGIFFTKLEPASFWRDKLGFNLNEVVCNVSDGLNIGEVMNKTTDNQIPLNIFQTIMTSPSYIGWPTIKCGSTFSSGTVTDATGTQFIYGFMESQDILPISSRYSYQSSNSGFYYVFADINFKNELLREDDKTSMSINQLSGIVSKFFLNSDYITGFSDSSIMYQHQGDPYLLGNIKINIYDSNMDLAILKKNSVVFFQIIKNSQSIQNVKSESGKNPMEK